jgi:hypothetical protein
VQLTDLQTSGSQRYYPRQICIAAEPDKHSLEEIRGHLAGGIHRDAPARSPKADRSGISLLTELTKQITQTFARVWNDGTRESAIEGQIPCGNARRSLRPP